jgi:hypothetical protein
MMRIAKQILLATIITVYFTAIHAQVFIELGPVQNNRDAFSSVTVYGSDGLRHSLRYDEINGQPFWKSNWSKAYFYDSRDTLLGSFKARFNFITNEVHYLDNVNREKAIIPGTLNKVIFMQEADSTAIATVFRANIPEIDKTATCKNCFVQELNLGDIKLLKITRRLLKSKDSLFFTIKKYYLEDEIEYFIQNVEFYHRVKKLNKDDMFSFIPGSSAYNMWVKEKGLRLNKEEDVLIFLNYYNYNRKKE